MLLTRRKEYLMAWKYRCDCCRRDCNERTTVIHTDGRKMEICEVCVEELIYNKDWRLYDI